MPSEKEKAFTLFNEGYRPHQIYDQVKVKRHTLYWYYQEWKKLQEAEGLEVEAEELEIKAEERNIELQVQAEEAIERAEQEANESARRQQQELKPLVDELHGIKVMLGHYRWYPDNLLLWWATHLEVNSIYPTPGAYLKALEKRRDYLRARIRGAMPVEQEIV